MALDLSNAVADGLDPGEFRGILKGASARLLGKDTSLSPFATTVEMAGRRDFDVPRGEDRLTRNPFGVDEGRVLFSKTWQDLASKPQVIPCPLKKVMTRMVHADRVAYISGEVATALGLCVPLARTGGRVHDIGHPVLGHFGEGLITETIFKIFAERGINGLGDVGAFMHHIHGVHVVDRIEKRRGHDGYGLCLTDQVRHAILSHNGEDEVSEISPDRNIDPEADIRRYIAEVIRNSGKVEFKGDIENAEDVARYMKEVSKAVKMAAITPATLEACIPRLVDTLQYGPNDLDDFIVAGLVKRDEIPEYVARELGTNAGDMIHTLVVDMIVHSYGKDRIGYSRRIAEVLMRFKREFLYPIYGRMDELLMDGGGGLGIMDVPKIDLKRKMLRLFRRNLRVLENPGAHRDSPLIADFFEGDVDNIARYQDRMWHIEGDAKNIQTVVDYVAGLTDRAFFRGSC